jgi:hypothetical protein
MNRRLPEFFVALSLINLSAVAADEAFSARPPLETTSVLAPVSEHEAADVTDGFSWGPVRVRPHAVYRFLHGTGILQRPGLEEETQMHQFAPGLLFQSGEVWSVDYTPNLKWYSNDRFKDTLDHAVTFAGRLYGDPWSFNLSQRYLSTSEPLSETGRQTAQEKHLTDFSAAYRYSDKSSLSFGISQSINLASEFNDSYQWSSLNWFHHQWLDRLGFGLGFGGGYASVEIGSDMAFESAQTRLQWTPGDNLRLDVHGGIEIRQFLDHTGSDRINPLAGITASYQPFSPTLLTLKVNRAVNNSLIGSQIAETLSFSASLRQRLAGKVFLHINAGRRTTDYLGMTARFRSERSDELDYLDVRASTHILKKGSIAVFIHVSDNASTASGFSYDSRQVGFEISYRF